MYTGISSKILPGNEYAGHPRKKSLPKLSLSNLWNKNISDSKRAIWERQ
jgi:hypothetical protein